MHSESGSYRGFFWFYIYYHGLAEAQCNGDLVRANQDLTYVEDGIHEVFIRNTTGRRPARLFLWSYDNGFGGTRRKGLIVFPDEPKDLEFALRHFNEKSKVI